MAPLLKLPKTLVPMHYGSFRLSYEPLEEPLRRLLIGARRAGLSDKISVMLEGRPEVF